MRVIDSKNKVCIDLPMGDTEAMMKLISDETPGGNGVKGSNASLINSITYE